MQWLNDEHIMEAADVAASFASRGFSTLREQWENIPGASLAPRGGVGKRYRVLSVDVRVQHTSGAIASGVRIWVAVIIHPMHTGYPLPVVEGVQSVSGLVSWQGNQDFGAGIVWRVAKGGLVVGDIVSITVGYENG